MGWHPLDKRLLGCKTQAPRNMMGLAMARSYIDGVQRYHQEEGFSGIEKMEFGGGAWELIRWLRRLLGTVWLFFFSVMGFTVAVHCIFPHLKQQFQGEDHSSTSNAPLAFVALNSLVSHSRSLEAFKARGMDRLSS